MRPLRAFLYSRNETGGWSCQTFRDFEPLFEAAMTAIGNPGSSAAIHVGFDRPSTDEVGDLTSKYAGQVLLSAGAAGSMPEQILASEHAIGMAGRVSFHLALDGFGYRIDDPSINYASATTSTGSASAATSVAPLALDAPRGWVVSLQTTYPDLAAKALSVGIWDDDSYIQHEEKLDVKTRHKIGILRYVMLEGDEPRPGTIVQRLQSAPPWLLSTPVAMLNMSVRLSNVCQAHGIVKVGDFAAYAGEGLRSLPNLGAKSINDLTTEIVNVFVSGRALVSEALARGIPLADIDSLPACLGREGFEVNQSGEEGRAPPKDGGTFKSITHGFADVAEQLPPKHRGIWASRVGYGGMPMTLQQIADQNNLTRERVRQIEADCYRKLKEQVFWSELSRRVSDHLHGRTSPLYLPGLAAVDQWFEGAGELDGPISEVCDHFPSLGFHCWDLYGSPILSRLSKKQFEEATEDARVLVRAIASQRLEEQDVIFQVRATLSGKGEDLEEVLWSEISALCIWAESSDGKRLLTGYGRSASALVLGVLQASDTPLHFDEILRRAKAYGSDAPKANYLRHAASEVGVLYARGTYGLREHCPLSTVQMAVIRAEVEDIMAGGPPTKQWHCSELFEALTERGLSFDGKLTKYIVNLALIDTPNLVYLRRMVWGLRSQWAEGADSRLDVRQAVIALLEQAGQPLSTAQIKARLAEERGVNSFFQIHATGPLLRVGAGLWGLAGRDVDMAEAEKLAYLLLKELARRQSGMHISEVAKFLSLESEDKVAVLLSVGQEDGLRLDQGEYCFLKAWGESRRMPIREAARAALTTHSSGLLIAELHEAVEQLVKRKIERGVLSSALQGLDAEYNQSSGVWTLPDTEDDEDTVEEMADFISDSSPMRREMRAER